MDWNSSELRTLVEKKHGLAQRKLLRHPLNSLVWKERLAQYHASEMTKALRESMPPDVQNESMEFAKEILRAASERDESIDFRIRQFVAEAHLIAFAQSLHSLADIMAGVVYLALDFPNSVGITLDDWKRTPRRIAEELVSRNHAPGVAAALHALLESEQFRYLRAYVNITKHRRLVITVRSAALREGKYGIRIREFEYNYQRKHENWSEKWASDFIEEDFSAVRDAVHSVGQALNDHLQGMPHT